MYIILILLHFVKSKEIINLEIDKSYTFYGDVPNSWLSYPVGEYKLEVPHDKNVYVVLLKNNITRSNLQLFMREQYQEGFFFAQGCNLNQHYICKIQSTEIIKKQIYYFLVFCKQNCFYELKVMTDNYNFYLNEGLRIVEQQENKGQSFSLNLTDFQYERIYIIIEGLSSIDQITIYINMNETIPTTKEFDIYLFQLHKTQIFLHRNYTHPQTILTSLINYNENESILIEVKTYQKIQEIHLFQEFKDQIIKDRVNYYKLKINDFKEDLLIFQVITEINKVNIYIQPCIEDRCEREYIDFEWQYQYDQGYNYYCIPPYKMIHTEVYMIAIHSKSDIVNYKLEVKLTGKIREILQPYKIQEGILEKNQIALYLIESQSANEYTHIDVQVNFPKGHGIILGKQCIKDYEEMAIVNDTYEYLENADINNYYNCSITPENASSIVSDNIQQENNLQFLINNTENQLQIPKLKFEYQSFVFQYLIAIYSSVDFMRYSLKSKKMEFQNIIVLKEFIIHSDSLKQSTSEIFSLFITQNTDQKVYFILAALLGEADTIFTTSIHYNIHPQKKLTSLQVDYMEYDNLISNSYTIHIKANTQLKYSIICILKNKFEAEIQYIPLTQAIPFKTIDLDLYFTFEITEFTILYINLKSLQGNFICHIHGSDKIVGDQSPKQSNLTLTSMQQTLIIENPKQFYYLYIQSTSFQQYEQYQIMYYHKTNFLELYIGETFYGMLNNQQTLFYYYQSFTNHSKLYCIITYQSEQNSENNLQIYISLINKYPDQLNYQYQIQPNQTYTTIPRINYENTIYIGIYSKGYNKYSLLIQDQNSMIELKENIIQTSPTIEQQNYYFYYIIPQNFSYPINIYAFTKFNLIELLCNIVQFDVRNIKNENYPTNTKYQIKEQISTNPSNKLLYINQSNLIQCKEQGCILLINAYILGHFDHFNIMVSFQYTIIRDLEMIIGYASQNIMSYYYFEIYQQQINIQITVRAIQDCDCNIYVQKSKLYDEILYPTIDKYSYKFTSDTLKISEHDSVGQYMIGVLAQNCIFEVLLNLRGFQLHYIHSGQFVETYIDNTVLYYYLNNHQEPFRIMIQNMKNIIAQIRSENNNEIIEQLANNSDLFGGIMQVYDNVCQSCTYILTLQPIRPTVLSLLFTYNNIPLQIEYGRIYYDHCLNNCEFKLKPGELNLFVYSKSINLIFYSKINHIIQKDLTYSYHLIPINESCILKINNDSYYSINLNYPHNPIILQLGKVFNGKNTFHSNQTQFILKIENTFQEYIVQVSSKSDIIIDIFLNTTDTNQIKIVSKQQFNINKSKKTLIYSFQQSDQPYYIILQSIDEYYIFVDFYNQNQYKHINFNNHYIEILQDAQQYNIQQIQEQELYFEKLDCLGETKFQKLSLSSSRETFFKIQVIERPYPIPFNIFSLVPHIQYSHDQWFIRNARFEIIKLSNEYLEITVNTMRRKKTGSLNLNKLIYKMHYSNQENIMRPLGCDLDIEFLKQYTNHSDSLFYNSSILEVKEKQESIQFIVLLNREFIYAQLVFQAFYENYNIPYTYFYNVTLIYNETDTKKIKMKDDIENEESNLIIIIIIGISLIFGIGLICLWILIPKQRQIRRELNEEQQNDQQYQQQFELQQLKQKEIVKIN